MGLVDLPVTAIAHSIEAVLAARAPAQVFEMVVRRVVVVMTRHQARRAWTNECFQHQRVNRAVDSYSEDYVQMLTGANLSRLQDSTKPSLRVWLTGSGDGCDCAIQ